MRIAYELQPLTRDKPNVTPPSSTEALPLADMEAWRLIIEAPAGCTFTGVGVLRGWLRHRLTGTWCVSADIEFQIPSGGVSGVVYPDVRQYVQGADVLMLATEGVTLDGVADNPAEANTVKVWIHGEGHR